MFAACNAFGLTRAERIDIATTLLDRNVESYRDLSPHEVQRLRDAFDGATLVCVLQMEKRAAQRLAAARPTARPHHTTRLTSRR